MALLSHESGWEAMKKLPGGGRTTTVRLLLMPAIATNHIRIDERGVAWIDHTNTKVIEVALDMIAYGWSPEEIHFQHSHLSLGQIHAALSYYYDHKSEIDAHIERGLQETHRRRAAASESPLRKRLREMGKL
jgi:uncharacterized protein (DUF433 family)